ncbi:hypothetical protein AB0912_17835 [Streptomyces sp. NPDC007084]
MSWADLKRTGLSRADLKRAGSGRADLAGRPGPEAAGGGGAVRP